MREILAARSKGRRSKSRCNHHWVIESPDGPISRGICKYCGAVKEFTNYLPFSTWDDDGTRYKSRQRSKDTVSSGVEDDS